MRGLRQSAFAVVAAILLLVAAPAVAGPKPTPAPTPAAPAAPAAPVSPPVQTSTQPVTPTAVADGESGADYLEATGEQTRAPVPATTAATTPPPAAVTTAPAPAVTPPAMPAPAAPSRAAEGDHQSIPRDGLVVLVAVLLAGLAVSVRAIRGRERRIGFALLAFCLVYLLVLGGLVTGVAGAASAPPSNVVATAGDGEILISFDQPVAPGITVSLARSSVAPPADCLDVTADELLTGLYDPPVLVEHGLENGTTYYYALCSDDGSSQSASVAVSATPLAGVVDVPPVTAARAVSGKHAVVISWRNPAGPVFDRTIVVRKIGSKPSSLMDGTLVAEGTGRSATDHPLSKRRVWYAIFAADADDTLSVPVYVSVARFDPWLRTPFDGQVVGSRPRFTWRRHSGDYYDIQIFRATASGRPLNPDRPLIDAHPSRESYTPTRRLRRGHYAWYIWAHTGGSHFSALGSQAFTVR